MISIIVAMSTNYVIGDNNTLPRHIPWDQKRFKELTQHHDIIMGRKTYESIGRLLPNRHNIIVSSSLQYSKLITSKNSTATIVSTLDEILAWCDRNKDKTIFCIGWGDIYKQFLPYTQQIELTLIKQEISGDVFFPDFIQDFEESHRTTIPASESVPEYAFIQYKRK